MSAILIAIRPQPRCAKADKPPSGKRPGEHDIITQFCPGSPVERYTHNLPAPMMEGDLEPLAQYAGQCVGLVKKRQSVHEILDEVVADAIKRINVCQTLVF